MKPEGPLHFWNNLTYHRLRFDVKADLIEKVIPLEDDFYLFLDRAKNYHLVTPNSNPNLGGGRYPIPFYANCLNPNTIYSVDYLHLYKYIYGKKISRKCMEDYYYHINQKRPKYLQFVYLGNHKLAIEMNRYDPLAIIDLQHPNQSPEIFDDISETELLINIGNGCIAWYERRTACVWLCCYSLHKRKRLNFTPLKIKGLYRLNNEIIIAKSKSNIELLNISKNTIIRSFNSLNSSEPLHLSVHSPTNTFSYISNGHIFVYTIEKGKIKSENFYDFKDYQKPCLGYTFIGDGYIAAKVEENIYIFMLDTHNFSLITVLQHIFPPYIGSQGLNAYCCNSAVKGGSIMQIESLDSNKFIVVGSSCKRQHLLHGLQRVDLFTCDFKEISEKKSCVFSATTSGSLESIFRSNYNISTTLLFEEYRDPVTVIDSLDDQNAALITERGRIFKVDLRLARVKEVTGLVELMAHKGVEVNETNFIDKFYLLNYDIVLISIKIGTSPYIRIVLFSLSMKSVKWDSNNLRNNGLDERYSFYDVLKVDGDTVLTSYNVKINQITVYQVGKLIINNENNKSYTFHHILSTDQNGQSINDKLWLIKDSIIGMRHVENIFHLTLLDYRSCQVLDEFHADKYFSTSNTDIGGIIDVKPLSEGVISMHVKIKYNDIILVYNWMTKELLNILKTENCLISTFKHAPFHGSRKANLESVAIFGFYAHTQHGIKIKSINDVIHDNNATNFEIDHKDFGMCIWPNNFSPVPNKKLSIAYESDHNKNYICLVRPLQFKLECLRAMKTKLKDEYHEIILRAILDMIFS